MENNSQNDKPKIGIGKIIFNISLVYYIYWICKAIWSFFFGSSWDFISFGRHNPRYGLDALEDVNDEFLLTTIIMFPFVPIYQLIYIAYTKTKENKKE